MKIIFDKILGRLRQSDAGGAGSGTVNKVLKWISGTVAGDSQITDDGTNVGIGTTTPSAKLHVKGVDATAVNSTLKAENSAGQTLLQARNDGIVSVGDFGGSNSYPGFPYGLGKVLSINYVANPICDIQIFSDDTTSETHFGNRYSYNFWVFGQGLVYRYDASDLKHNFKKTVLAETDVNSGGGHEFKNISAFNTIQIGIKGHSIGAGIYNVGGFFTASGATENFALHTVGKVKMINLPTFANNATALVGGLVADDVYKTVTGELRIVV